MSSPARTRPVRAFPSGSHPVRSLFHKPRKKTANIARNARSPAKPVSARYPNTVLCARSNQVSVALPGTKCRGSKYLSNTVPKFSGPQPKSGLSRKPCQAEFQVQNLVCAVSSFKFKKKKKFFFLSFCSQGDLRNI